jgi:hypothetical protein
VRVSELISGLLMVIWFSLVASSRTEMLDSREGKFGLLQGD